MEVRWSDSRSNRFIPG